MTLPDPGHIELTVRAGIRTVAITFSGYDGSPIDWKIRRQLRSALHDAIEALNDEIARSTRVR